MTTPVPRLACSTCIWRICFLSRTHVILIRPEPFNNAKCCVAEDGTFSVAATTACDCNWCDCFSSRTDPSFMQGELVQTYACAFPLLNEPYVVLPFISYGSHSGSLDHQNTWRQRSAIVRQSEDKHNRTCNTYIGIPFDPVTEVKGYTNTSLSWFRKKNNWADLTQTLQEGEAKLL